MKLYENDWLFINNLLLKMYSSESNNLINSSLMENLSRLIPYDKVSFFLHNHDGKMYLKNPEGIGFPERILDEFCTRSLDSVPHLWVNMYTRSIVLRDSDMFPEDIRSETPYYQSLFEEQNVKYALTLSLAHEGFSIGVLTLFRQSDKHDFTDRELYMAEQIIDHIACFSYSIYGFKEKNSLPKNSFKDVTEKYSLSSRESEVLQCICNGNTTKEICDMLFIAETTLKKHLSHIYTKMGIKSKTELIKILTPVQ